MIQGDDKTAQRRAARTHRRAMPLGEVASASAAITQRVLELPEWRAAPVIFAYAAAGNEVDTRALMREALAAGKTVCCPRVDGAHMTWHAVAVLDTLRAGTFGILEPPPDAAPAPAAPAASVCLVPGLGFRSDGHRLGQGGGHYDRFLAAFPGTSIGLAYAWQLHPVLHVEAHDVPVHIIVSEGLVLRVPPA